MMIIAGTTSRANPRIESMTRTLAENTTMDLGAAGLDQGASGRPVIAGWNTRQAWGPKSA